MRGYYASLLKIKKAIVSSFYQSLPLGDPTVLTNEGTGGSDLDAVLVSGTMSGKDIVLNINPNDDDLVRDKLDELGVPNPEITYAEMANINEYPFAQNQKQLFFTGENDIVDLELIDHSPNLVNAKIKGLAAWQDGGISRIDLINPIDIDYRDAGFKWEYVYSLDVGETQSDMYRYADTNGIIRLRTSVFLLYLELSTGGTTLLGFAVPSIADGILRRIKCEVDESQNVTIMQSSFDDDEYISGSVVSDTHNINEWGNYLDIQASQIQDISSPTVKFNGMLKQVNLMGQIFNFEDGFYKAGVDQFGIFSNTIINFANFTDGDGTEQWIWQDDICYNKDGYTRVYINGGRGIFNLTYVDGESRIEAFKTFWATQVDEIVGYEEFPSGIFGQGYGFELNSSEVSIGEPYFTASVANTITSSEQPNTFDDKTYYDRTLNKGILVLDSAENIDNTFNPVGKLFGSIGDSVSGNSWTVVMANKLGMELRLSNYGGFTSAGVLENLELAVASDPNWIYDMDLITVSCMYNDYGLNTSKAQLEIDFDALIAYIVSEKRSDVSIVINSPYNWGYPTIDDGTTPNTAGLTRNDCREIAESTANTYDCELTEWVNAGMIEEDFSDDTASHVHPATSTGSVKLSNKTIETVNSIGYIDGLEIDPNEFSLNNSEDIFKDWAVKKKVDAIVPSLDFSDEENSQYEPLI